MDTFLVSVHPEENIQEMELVEALIEASEDCFAPVKED